MEYRTCVIVLIGSETSSREWCRYEIEHAWKEGKGIVGIYVHNLKDFNGKQDKRGTNPFNLFYIDRTYNYIVERNILLMAMKLIYPKYVRLMNHHIKSVQMYMIILRNT